MHQTKDDRRRGAIERKVAAIQRWRKALERVDDKQNLSPEESNRQKRSIEAKIQIHVRDILYTERNLGHRL